MFMFDFAHINKTITKRTYSNMFNIVIKVLLIFMPLNKYRHNIWDGISSSIGRITNYNNS